MKTIEIKSIKIAPYNYRGAGLIINNRYKLIFVSSDDADEFIDKLYCATSRFCEDDFKNSKEII